MTAAVRRMSTQFIARITGARNTPPPVPVVPETKPIGAPAESAGQNGGSAGGARPGAVRARAAVRKSWIAAAIRMAPTRGK